MIPELESVEDKYRRLVQALADPSVLSDPKKFRDLSKERADMMNAGRDTFLRL